MISLALTLVVVSANPFLAEGLEHEKNLDFERCVQRLKQASTQWKNEPAELRDIELHWGLCAFNLGDKKGALEHFRMALRVDEATELPAYTSPKAVELFLAVKRSLQAAAPPMPDEDLLKEGQDAPVVEKKKKLEPVTVKEVKDQPPSEFGLFLQHRAVPLTLGVVALGTAITGLALGLRAQDVANQANGARFESDFYKLGADATGLATGSTISWVLAGTSAVAAVVVWLVMGDPPTSARAP
ncbi:MAG: hypothetical protein QM817_19570 [Archangium sp.]